MELISNLDLKRVAGLDIETVRIVEHYKDLSEQYKLAWQYKQKQDGIVPSEEELADLWERTASLYAEFSKVCAVSIAYLNKAGELESLSYAGANEVALLVDTADLLDRLFLAKFILAGHAVKYFDFPYLCKRYVVNSIPIPKLIDTAHLKPWENTNLDTNMDVWKMGGTGPGSSLLALAVCLGIPISKVDLVGDEVGAAYFEGKYADIGRYCAYDAVTCFNILRRIKGEDIFKFDNVKFK